MFAPRPPSSVTYRSACSQHYGNRRPRGKTKTPGTRGDRDRPMHIHRPTPGTYGSCPPTHSGGVHCAWRVSPYFFGLTRTAEDPSGIYGKVMSKTLAMFWGPVEEVYWLHFPTPAACMSGPPNRQSICGGNTDGMLGRARVPTSRGCARRVQVAVPDVAYRVPMEAPVCIICGYVYAAGAEVSWAGTEHDVMAARGRTSCATAEDTAEQNSPCG